jgi:predicted DNA-binding protein
VLYVSSDMLYSGRRQVRKRDVKVTSFRLTPEARRLLSALAEKKGVAMTAVLEFLIRKEAKEEDIK